jgi:hypothetical protein
MQMKLGVQWAPIPEVRIGWMAATPSYLVYLNNETTETQQLSAGDPPFSGTQVDDLSGTWSGVERGLTRLGAAYLGKWGWIEADLIVGFPLKTSALDIDWNATADVRLGAIVRITEKLKLGAGFSTDFSPENTPTDFGDSKINFYSLTVGFDFANSISPSRPPSNTPTAAVTSQACCSPTNFRTHPPKLWSTSQSTSSAST